MIGPSSLRDFFCLDSPEVEVPKRRVHGGVRHKATLSCIVYADPKADVSSDDESLLLNPVIFL